MLEANLWAKDDTSPVANLLQERLHKPFQALKNRPSHKFRAKLVEEGVRLAGSSLTLQSKNVAICSEAIEALHLGSLIVDDIQDESPTRRNGASLHTELGIPHALSVGNWLYFHASQKLHKLQLTDSQLCKIQKAWLEAIECAHYGQVLDLTTRMDKLQKHEVNEVCYYTSYYKTGCITGLAITLGAIVAGANDERLAKIKDLGCALGVYLQQLNDIGNLCGAFDLEKRYEDLTTLKPSFIWSLALDHFGAGAFDDLMQATQSMPDTQLIEQWLKKHPANVLAPIVAGEMFDSTLLDFQTAFPEIDLVEILQLKDRIQKAYA